MPSAPFNSAKEVPTTPVDIAFLTVSYNTLQCTEQLTTFFSTLDVPFTFSFTVVDNASNDGSQEFLRSHPEIHYLQSGENLGYGRAINRAVAATNSAYICVTNTDVTLNPEALISLWRFMEEHPDAGLCAPRIFYEDGRDQGMVFHASLTSQYVQWYAKHRARSAKREIAMAAEPVKVEGVMGAFFLMRRSALPSQKLFDEDFFLFYEDTALSHTLFNRGVRALWFPRPPSFISAANPAQNLPSRASTKANISTCKNSMALPTPGPSTIWIARASFASGWVFAFFAVQHFRTYPEQTPLLQSRLEVSSPLVSRPSQQNCHPEPRVVCGVRGLLFALRHRFSGQIPHTPTRRPQLHNPIALPNHQQHQPTHNRNHTRHLRVGKPPNPRRINPNNLHQKPRNSRQYQVVAKNLSHRPWILLQSTGPQPPEQPPDRAPSNQLIQRRRMHPFRRRQNPIRKTHSPGQRSRLPIISIP